MKILLIIVGLIFFGLIIWFLIHISNRSAKDWADVKKLKEKANKASTKEEIEEVHKELLEISGKVLHNKYIRIELRLIDAYLRGLYKQFKT